MASDSGLAWRSEGWTAATISRNLFIINENSGSPAEECGSMVRCQRCSQSEKLRPDDFVVCIYPTRTQTANASYKQRQRGEFHPADSTAAMVLSNWPERFDLW